MWHLAATLEAMAQEDIWKALTHASAAKAAARAIVLVLSLRSFGIPASATVGSEAQTQAAFWPCLHSRTCLHAVPSNLRNKILGYSWVRRRRRGVWLYTPIGRNTGSPILSVTWDILNINFYLVPCDKGQAWLEPLS